MLLPLSKALIIIRALPDLGRRLLSLGRAQWTTGALYPKLARIGGALGGKEASQDSVMENRPAGGPPDLDDVFRDWKRKVDQLLGEVMKGAKPGMKNSGGNDGDPPDGGKHSGGNQPNNPTIFWAVSLSAMVIALLIWLASGFYVVDANERAVVMQFGRYTHTTEPGLNWRLPYPFQTHEKVVFSSVRTIDVGGNGTNAARRSLGNENNNNAAGVQMLTGDENVLLVHYSVQYDVLEADGFVFNDVSPEATARLSAETAMREVVGSSTLDKVLYEDREVVAHDARDKMQDILDRYKVGIRVLRVNLQSVRPPEQVQAAFDDAIKASQDRQRQINEGEAYAQDVVPRARGAASRMLEQAQGYRESVVARAEGEASHFQKVVSEYRSAKGVTRDRMYYDAMADVLSRSKKIVIDPNARSLIQLSSPSTGQGNNGAGVLLQDTLNPPPPTANTRNSETPRPSDRLQNRARP